MLNLLLFIGENLYFSLQVLAALKSPIKERITKHRRLEERESGVGVSDSSGFLPKTPPLHLVLVLFVSFQMLILLDY